MEEKHDPFNQGKEEELEALTANEQFVLLVICIAGLSALYYIIKSLPEIFS